MKKRVISEFEMAQDGDLEFYDSLNNTLNGELSEMGEEDPQEDPTDETDPDEVSKSANEGGQIYAEKGPVTITTRSKLDAGAAIEAVTVLKKVLLKHDCQLKDWRIKFHNAGFDVTNIRIIPGDLAAIRAKSDKADIIQFRDKPTALVMKVIAPDLKMALADELAFDGKFYVYDGANIASMTIVNQDPAEDMEDFAAIAPDLEAMAEQPLGGPEEGLGEEPAPEVGGEPELEGEATEEAPEGEELAPEGEEAPEIGEETPEGGEDVEDEEDLDAAIASLSQSLGQ